MIFDERCFLTFFSREKLWQEWDLLSEDKQRTETWPLFVKCNTFQKNVFFCSSHSNGRWITRTDSLSRSSGWWISQMENLSHSNGWWFISNGELEPFKRLMNFLERIAEAVRTADDFFRTDSLSLSNGWWIFVNGKLEALERQASLFERLMNGLWTANSV